MKERRVRIHSFFYQSCFLTFFQKISENQAVTIILKHPRKTENNLTRTLTSLQRFEVLRLRPVLTKASLKIRRLSQTRFHFESLLAMKFFRFTLLFSFFIINSALKKLEFLSRIRYLFKFFILLIWDIPITINPLQSSSFYWFFPSTSTQFTRSFLFAAFSFSVRKTRTKPVSGSERTTNKQSERATPCRSPLSSPHPPPHTVSSRVHLCGGSTGRPVQLACMPNALYGETKMLPIRNPHKSSCPPFFWRSHLHWRYFLLLPFNYFTLHARSSHISFVIFKYRFFQLSFPNFLRIFVLFHYFLLINIISNRLYIVFWFFRWILTKPTRHLKKSSTAPNSQPTMINWN